MYGKAMNMDEGPDLAVEIAGLRFRNPLLLASGIADETGMSMAMAANKGAGGVVTKSLSLEPRDGHPNPCVVELPFGMMNAMGLPNPGIEAYKEEVEIFRDGIEENSIIIGSVFGATLEEYGEAARATEAIGVDAVEINGSCPNAKGLGLQFGQDPDVIRELVSVVKSKVDIPVFFKLTPNTQDIVTLAYAAQEGGADGLVAINTLQAMQIDIHSRRPVLTNITGGLSGPAIKPVGVRCVYAMASDERIHIPIIAVGGASTAEDVLEYMIAGASAVQVGTAVSWNDLDVFTQMVYGIKGYLVEKGISRVQDIIGSVKGVRK